MQASDVTATQSVATTVGTQTVPEERKDISADFDTFLSLLTAQLRSQDPLNPVNSTDFIAQLASFSAVEQQTRTNELLSEFISRVDGRDSAVNLVSLIGQEVAVAGPARFDGETPISLYLPTSDGARSATLSIEDDFGTTVAEFAVNPDASTHEWDGRTSTGETAPAGDYHGKVSYYGDGSEPAAVAAGAFATVHEVRVEGDGPRLLVDGGRSVVPEAIFAVRNGT